MPGAAPALVSADDLTPDWCTAALAPVIGPARVVSCEMEAIGTGQLAETVRLTLAYDRPGAGPASCVAKVTARSPGSRTAARVNRCYETEVGFYRDLAPTVAVRRPHCHHAVHDPATGAYTVLLEDVAGARTGDQLAGCTVDEVALAVEAMGALHASRWGDPALASLPWLVRLGEPAAVARLGELTALVAPRFLRRHGGALDPEVAALVERLPALVPGHLAGPGGARTVVHGDFRADNLLFGAGAVTVIDWQTVALGPGVGDLSYLLGASVPTGVRRGCERDVVGIYRGVLRAAGVVLRDEELWAGYRRQALGGLLVTVVAAVLVPHTARGDHLFVTMAGRHGRHALDLGTEALVRI
jgi:hypothetical protein